MGLYIFFDIVSDVFIRGGNWASNLDKRINKGSISPHLASEFAHLKLVDKMLNESLGRRVVLRYLCHC